MVGAQTAAPVATVPAVSNGTNASDSLVRLVPALLSPNRRGIVYDRWPFRLDIDTEYQDWILVATCVLVFGIWCTPCICGRLSNPCSRCFTSWVYTRLHVFFCIVSYLNLIILMLVIGILPYWTVNEFAMYLILFVAWVLIHLQKMIISFCILFGFYMLLKFRDRLAWAAGLQHVTVIKFNWRDLFGLQAKKRPVEIFIWKIEELYSASGKVFKANDVYVECHLGYNEPMRTRVHNNAGHTVMVRESFQMNIDENAAATDMTLLVKDQQLVGSTELGRLILRTRELCGIEDQTGKRRENLQYNEECFVGLNLMPNGKIWLAVAPVEVGDEERAPLMNEDSLVTC